MPQKCIQTPVLVCSDNLDEQARLATLLAADYDNILTCFSAQFDSMLEREPNASVVASWCQPSAELKQIISLCSEKRAPLLVVVQQLNSNDINRLPERMDYVLLPSDSTFSLMPWIEHAHLTRRSYIEMDQEIETLSTRLEERKLIEKAKGLLMKMHNVDEQAAYSAMRKSAMQSSLPLAQVAKNLLSTLEAFE